MFPSPKYSVKYYRPGMYKVIRFDTPRGSFVPKVRDSSSTSEQKLSQSISRAKSVILQLAMCNSWDWFFTCTLDGGKHNRYSIDAFRVRFPQWIRDYNKRYGCSIKYLLIPELHKDGAYHVHGFLMGIPECHLSRFIRGVHPRDLVDGNFMNWGRCSQKFGYCSLALIRDPIGASFYVTKYVTKDLASDSALPGRHIYYSSLGLSRAQHMGYVYGSSLALDLYIDSVFPYCSTGWCDREDWLFWVQLLDVESMTNLFDYGPEPEEASDLLPAEQFDQLNIAGWCNGNTWALQS